MDFKIRCFQVLCLLTTSVLATTATPSISNSQTSLTLLYQNNLNGTDDINHISFILLDSLSQKDASSACSSIGESLLPKSTIQKYKSDISQSLSYLAYSGKSSGIQSYYIDSGILLFNQFTQSLDFKTYPFSGTRLPVLCTQSSTQNQPGISVATSANQISVASNGNTYTGYRNLKSFRFLGIPYADPVERFTYSTLFSSKGKTINSTAYGEECPQYGNGNEDCLFLNIQTPYIPKSGCSDKLKPVLFWIHGGGFTGGSGADSLSDGGNLASREDVVVVNVNYRLSTLGFLVVPGTNVTGNYGIADQITALEWTIKNIASFGGDPTKITISGESAGAGSVRVLLGSPPAKGKFQGAVSMSNLGGGVNLGLSGDYATTYSSYLTINQSYALAGQQIFTAAGCTQITLDAQISCLKALPAQTVNGLSTVARYVVQDGHFVNTENLDLLHGSAAHVPVIFGITANDGASFSTYPGTPVTSELAGIQASLGISSLYAQNIIDSKLFPYYDTGNITLDSFNVSQRIATDSQFRCIDQATVYAAAKSGAFPRAYFYQMERTINGYDPNNLGGAPVSPGYPNGNPNLPYFRLHGSDMPWVFGTLGTLRDADDLYSVQLSTAYFTAFVKEGKPSPEGGYLEARGYEKTIEAIRDTGEWEAVGGKEGPIRLLDYPATEATFVDVEQCAWLNYSISYYVDGGK